MLRRVGQDVADEGRALSRLCKSGASMSTPMAVQPVRDLAGCRARFLRSRPDSPAAARRATACNPPLTARLAGCDASGSGSGQCRADARDWVGGYAVPVRWQHAGRWLRLQRAGQLRLSRHARPAAAAQRARIGRVAGAENPSRPAGGRRFGVFRQRWCRQPCWYLCWRRPFRACTEHWGAGPAGSTRWCLVARPLQRSPPRASLK